MNLITGSLHDVPRNMYKCSGSQGEGEVGFEIYPHLPKPISFVMQYTLMDFTGECVGAVWIHMAI